VPGFLRRMEAQNHSGAARLLHERNPLAEVCGYDCAADPPCQSDCYRISFAGTPVRIAELQRWSVRLPEKKVGFRQTGNRPAGASPWPAVRLPG